MTFPANENFPRDAVAALRAVGCDVAWVRTDAPGSADAAVSARAVTEGRLLPTFDKDFGELAFRAGLPAACGVVLVRIPLDDLPAAVRRVVAAVTSRDDWPGHFSVIEPDRVRMRPLPEGRA
jgi:predicted nuclease of predicted toxin-antitoxin system